MDGFIFYLTIILFTIVPAAFLCLILGALGAPLWAIALFFLWPRMQQIK